MEENFCIDKKRSKHWLIKVVFIPIIIAAFIFGLSWVVMFLWNSILPEVISVKAITYWQAMGILILSKILFGSFHGRRSHHSWHSRERAWKEKWSKLTPEQKEKIREQWWCKLDLKKTEE